MKKTVIKTLLLLALLSLAMTQDEDEIETISVKSRIKTFESYRTPNIPSNQIYSIDVKRVESSKAAQVKRCWSLPRQIQAKNSSELFRLSKNKDNNREQKVYEKLTTLTEMENIIEEFQIIGDNIFIITSDSSGYFISINDSSKIKKVQTNFFQQRNQKYFDQIILKQFRGKVLLISHDNFMICSDDKETCTKLQGYEPMKKFKGAQIFNDDGKDIVFLIGSHQIRSYELQNEQLKYKKIYNQTFFGVEKIHLQSLVKVGPSTFYVLDSLRGIWEMGSDSGISPSKSLGVKKDLVFEQFGCYQLIEQNLGETLILACNPSYNNYFILNLMRSTQFTDGITYEPLQTVFMQDQLYQIQAVDNILMSRVYTGVKLYWSSKKIGNPYPYFYRTAGTIFLHNAIQSKLKVINGKKMIFIAAEDELLKYELKSIDPYISCYSQIEVNEQYELNYQVECDQTFSTFVINTVGKEQTCTKTQMLNFETWAHKEVRVGSHIIPFILSLGGVVLMVFCVTKIYKKFNNQVDEARRKYNINEDQLSI